MLIMTAPTAATRIAMKGCDAQSQRASPALNENASDSITIAMPTGSNGERARVFLVSIAPFLVDLSLAMLPRRPAIEKRRSAVADLLHGQNAWNTLTEQISTLTYRRVRRTGRGRLRCCLRQLVVGSYGIYSVGGG